VNLRGLDVEFGQTADDVLLVCECSRADCIRRIRVSPDVYEKLCADPDTFIILPGHEAAEDETVSRGNSFDLVMLSATRAEERFLVQRTEMRRQLGAEFESLRATVEWPEEIPLIELKACLQGIIRRYLGEEWLHRADTQESLVQIYDNYAGLETADERLAALERISRTLGVGQ